ncbi:MAG: hypothetical protein V4719_02295 [Planctomycetota bacterium]
MTPRYQPWLHRFAVFTAAVALLLPITVGALVTTHDAGMAFRDWPSSDGHNMILYPWLQSVGDKFLEHGHRLAGMLVGVISIGLAAALWFGESRRWVRYLGVAVLLCVIGQGLLGGRRVVVDARGLAMIHGLFASWVFALMSCVAVVTSKSWFESETYKIDEWNLGTGISAVTAVVAVQLQFILGGLLRHLGLAVYEHIGFAFLVLLAVMWLWVGSYTSGVKWLRRNAGALMACVLLQIGLGLMTFVAKYGFGDYVAQQGSPLQIWSRTGHTVLGMMVWMLSVVYLVRVIRIMWLRQQPHDSMRSAMNSGALAAGGTP